MVMLDPLDEDTVMVESVVENDHNTNGFINPRDLHPRGNGNIDFEEDMVNMLDASETSAVSNASLAPPRRSTFLLVVATMTE